MIELNIDGKKTSFSPWAKGEDGKIDLVASIKCWWGFMTVVAAIGMVLITGGLFFGKLWADQKLRDMHKKIFIPTMTTFVGKIAYTRGEADSLRRVDNEKVFKLLTEISTQNKINIRMHIDENGIDAYYAAVKKEKAIGGGE